MFRLCQFGLNNDSLFKMLANFFCKGPDGKYFQLCGHTSSIATLSAAIITIRQPYVNENFIYKNWWFTRLSRAIVCVPWSRSVVTNMWSLDQRHCHHLGIF